MIQKQNHFLSDPLKEDCKAVSLEITASPGRIFYLPFLIHNFWLCLAIRATLNTTFYDKVGWPQVFIYNALVKQLLSHSLSLLWHSDPYPAPCRDGPMFHDPRVRSDLPKITLTFSAEASWNNLLCHVNIKTHAPVCDFKTVSSTFHLQFLAVTALIESMHGCLNMLTTPMLLNVHKFKPFSLKKKNTVFKWTVICWWRSHETMRKDCLSIKH